MKPQRWGFASRAVHGGETGDRPFDAITTPIFSTSTYVFKNTAELIDYMEGRRQRMEYGRYGNPTQQVAQDKLAALEGAEAALLFSTGMCAITTTLLAMLSQGSHAILTNDCYRRTKQFCLTVLRRYGINITVVEMGNYEALEQAIQPRTRLIFSESPTNPHLRVIDLERLVAVARRHQLKVVIDSTFATPYNQRPLEFGVDLVIHSATKYLGGHNDLLAGGVLGPRPMIDALQDLQAMMGGIVDPWSAYLLIRGLKTFPLRIRRQNDSALMIAQFLESHPKVRRVYYPGLPSHPDHPVACQQMRGFGGVISFEIEGDGKSASAFIDGVSVPLIAPSLGGVESLIEQPSLMSYYEMPAVERSANGIKDELVRLSVGIEDVEDLIADLKQSLERL